METSDLPSDTDTTNATIAMNFFTESKSVNRRALADRRKVPRTAAV